MSDAAIPTAWRRCVQAVTVSSVCLFLIAACSLLSPWFWLADLIANLVWQLLLLNLVVGGLALILRCRLVVFLLLVAAIPLVLLLFATPRAATTAGPISESDRVRLLLFNATSVNPTPEAVLAVLASAEADIALVLETPLEVIEGIRDDGALAELYPHHQIPPTARGGYSAIISRWPIEWITVTVDGEDRRVLGPRGVRIHRPAGPIQIALIHPRSPRSPKRWREGNLLIEHVMAIVNGPYAQTGEPIIVAGDINSAPSAWRSRKLASGTGLKRAKPRWKPAGTWPTFLRWPLTIAIDDAFVCNEIQILTWERLEPSGSEHWPVLIEMSVPPIGGTGGL